MPARPDTSGGLSVVVYTTTEGLTMKLDKLQRKAYFRSVATPKQIMRRLRGSLDAWQQQRENRRNK